MPESAAAVHFSRSQLSLPSSMVGRVSSEAFSFSSAEASSFSPGWSPVCPPGWSAVLPPVCSPACFADWSPETCSAGSFVELPAAAACSRARRASSAAFAAASASRMTSAFRISLAAASSPVLRTASVRSIPSSYRKLSPVGSSPFRVYHRNRQIYSAPWET